MAEKLIKHRSGSAGGYLQGRSHATGGIKAVNRSNDEPLEMEGGEVVITKPAVEDNSLHDFEGEKLTNRQILSRINESGGGVKFADGGPVPDSIHCTGKTYKYGGETKTDYDIVSGCGCQHAKMEGGGDVDAGSFPGKFLPSHNGFSHKATIPKDLTEVEQKLIHYFKVRKAGHVSVAAENVHEIKNLLDSHIIYTTGKRSSGYVEVHLTSRGHHAIDALKKEFKKGGEVRTESEPDISDLDLKPNLYHGFDTYHGPKFQYDNAFAINKAIEELLDKRADTELDTDEKKFISYYSGYGGLEKFGASGVGLLFEYFTPSLIAKKMWGLAYKYGYQGGSVFEPSAGVGEFFKYAPADADVSGFEINKYSARICKILYPQVNIENKYFEELFLKNRDTIRDRTDALKKYDLVIGNPPYGKFEGKFAGMGEKSYTRATNYIDYFIYRGLDLLRPGGLLIYIIGAEVAAGGIPFLQQGANAVKKEIAERSELLDAYRLPNGVFERTDVLTDIIVLKKL